jgi:hypothetical protein
MDEFRQVVRLIGNRRQPRSPRPAGQTCCDCLVQASELSEAASLSSTCHFPRVTRLKDLDDFRLLPLLSHLTELRFSWNFRLRIRPGQLPRSLISLHLGHRWNQPIEAGVLPSQLTSFALSHDFNYALSVGAFPPSLLSLTFGADVQSFHCCECSAFIAARAEIQLSRNVQSTHNARRTPSIADNSGIERSVQSTHRSRSAASRADNTRVGYSVQAAVGSGLYLRP